MSRNDGTIYYTEEELQERAYLADDTLIPDIPEDITAQFEEVLETYKDYSRKDNASEEDDEALAKQEDFLRRAFVFAFKAHRSRNSRLIPRRSQLRSCTIRSKTR